jgi:hypothetical protein
VCLIKANDYPFSAVRIGCDVFTRFRACLETRQDRMTGTKQANIQNRNTYCPKLWRRAATVAKHGCSCCCKACNVLQLNVQFNHSALRDNRAPDQLLYNARPTTLARLLLPVMPPMCCSISKTRIHEMVEEIRCGRVWNCHLWLSVCLPFLVPMFSIITI